MHTRNKPLVSVIMPVYNAEKYIETAITSILNQTYNNFEFIIIDDASTDNSLKLIREFKDKRIVLIRNNRNLGVTKSLNKGLDLVKGKYTLRMDADDWSYPTRIETQVKLMEFNNDVVVSGSHIEVCDEQLITKYLRRYWISDSEIRNHLFRYSPFAHPSTIWRSEIVKREKYNESIRTGQDYELYFRMGRRGKFMNSDKYLLKLRMHEKSVSTSMNNQQSEATVKIRWDAVNKLGYSMTIFDRLYNLIQLLCIGLLPVRLRFFIFNSLRNLNFY